MTAAFLYCGGYRASTSWMSSSFCAVNLKGIEGLLTGVLRCWGRCQLSMGKVHMGYGRTSYHEERVAPLGRRRGEGSPLRTLKLARDPRCASEEEGRQLRGHGVWRGDWSGVLEGTQIEMLMMNLGALSPAETRQPCAIGQSVATIVNTYLNFNFDAGDAWNSLAFPPWQ